MTMTKAYGVEAQFCQDEEVPIGRRLERRMDPTQTPWERAIVWAGDEGQALVREDPRCN